MKIITTHEAPEAIGPFSLAVVSGDLLFCSGQVPLDAETMELVGTNIEEQTEKVLKNMRTILISAGLDFPKLVKTTVFLKDMKEFWCMNAVYERILSGHKPARSTVEVAQLPLNAMVEIECIASVAG